MENGNILTPFNERLLARTNHGLARLRRVVVIGDSGAVAAALEHPLLSSAAFEVVGIVRVDIESCEALDADVQRIVGEHEAGVLLVSGTLPRAIIVQLGELAVLLGCRLLSLLPNTRDTLLMPTVMMEGRQPYVEVAILPNRHRLDRWKRLFDVMVSAFILLLVIPLVLAAAASVALESPGSPFFGHVRIGRGGRRFRCWKLRTMHPDAEARLEREPELFARYRDNDFKLPDDADPRVTRIGRILRRTSLDELPQLWNVVVGDMSLVGPRPVVKEELQHYRGAVLTLLSIRPGITGAWAVSGRHNLAYPRRAQVELDYVRTRTIRRDLTILWRTLSAVLDPGFARKTDANHSANVEAPDSAATMDHEQSEMPAA